MLLYGLQHYIEINDVLHPFQIGFRPHASAQDTVLLLHEHILLPTSTVQTRTVVGIDIKRAFDTVTHESVIESAEHFGITGRALNFITSFYSIVLMKLQ